MLTQRKSALDDYLLLAYDNLIVQFSVSRSSHGKTISTGHNVVAVVAVLQGFTRVSLGFSREIAFFSSPENSFKKKHGR